MFVFILVGVQNHKHHYIHPINAVFVPSIQDTVKVAFTNPQSWMLFRGNEVVPFENFLNVHALATGNFTHGGNGWIHYDQKDFINKEHPNNPMYKPQKTPYRPNDKNVDKNASTNKINPGFEKCYVRCRWPNVKNYRKLEVTRTIELKTNSTKINKTLCLAQKCFGFMGIKQLPGVQPIKATDASDKFKNDDYVKLQAKYKKHKKKIAKSIDSNLPHFELNEINCKELLGTQHIQFVEFGNARDAIEKKFEENAKDITMTKWDKKYLQCIDTDDLENFWRNSNAEDDDLSDEQEIKLENWDWLHESIDNISKDTAIEVVDKITNGLEQRLWIIGLYYISKYDANIMGNVDKIIQTQMLKSVNAELTQVYGILLKLDTLKRPKVIQFLSRENLKCFSYALYHIKIMHYLNAMYCNFIGTNDDWQLAIIDQFDQINMADQAKILEQIVQPPQSQNRGVNTYVRELRVQGLQKIFVKFFTNRVNQWQNEEEFKNKYETCWHLTDDWKQQLETEQHKQAQQQKRIQASQQNQKQNTNASNENNSENSNDTSNNNNNDKSKKRRSLQSDKAVEPSKKKRKIVKQNQRFPTAYIENQTIGQPVKIESQNGIYAWLDSILPEDVFKDSANGKNQIMTKIHSELQEYFVINQIKAFQKLEMGQSIESVTTSGDLSMIEANNQNGKLEMTSPDSNVNEIEMNSNQDNKKNDNENVSVIADASQANEIKLSDKNDSNMDDQNDDKQNGVQNLQSHDNESSQNKQLKENEDDDMNMENNIDNNNDTNSDHENEDDDMNMSCTESNDNSNKQKSSAKSSHQTTLEEGEIEESDNNNDNNHKSNKKLRKSSKKSDSSSSSNSKSSKKLSKSSKKQKRASVNNNKDDEKVKDKSNKNAKQHSSKSNNHR